MATPSPSLIARIQRLLPSRKAIDWRPVNRGYTPAERYVVTFNDASSCFVKVGTNDWTADALRAEYRAYSRLKAPFLPAMLAWDDAPLSPILVTEDLSAAFWPPPWDTARIDAVFETLAAIHSTRVPGPSRLIDILPLANWKDLEADPAPFLSLGLCAPRWLTAALPVLQQAEAAAPFDGNDLLHLDVRSDNICFVDGKALLVDWNVASYGNGAFDVAQWLPSLESEGGPPPETFLPHAPEFAASVSGYFALRAPHVKPPIHVENIQRRQLLYALPWAARALDLPPLDGPNAL